MNYWHFILGYRGCLRKEQVPFMLEASSYSKLKS